MQSNADVTTNRYVDCKSSSYTPILLYYASSLFTNNCMSFLTKYYSYQRATSYHETKNDENGLSYGIRARCSQANHTCELIN